MAAPMDEQMGCAAILVTHKRPQILQRTLASFAACRLPEGLVEIVVVENGDPACGSRELVEQMQTAIPISHYFVPDKRKSVAMNFALRQVRSRFLCLFDDDIRLERDCLLAYAAAARRYDPGHFFGGPHETEGGNPPPEWMRRHLPVSAFPWGYGGEERLLEPRREQTMFMGFNWAAFKDDLLAAGGFPEFPKAVPSSGSGDETLTQRRLMARGAKPVYVPAAKTWHYVPDQDCSYAFAVSRARFAGRSICVMEGLEGEMPASALPPLWLLRRLAELYVKQRLAHLRRLPLEQLLMADRDLAYVSGMLEGRRILRRAAPELAGTAQPSPT